MIWANWGGSGSNSSVALLRSTASKWSDAFHVRKCEMYCQEHALPYFERLRLIRAINDDNISCFQKTVRAGVSGLSSLAEKLKHCREELALSLEAVKLRTGIGVSTLSEFENGKREPKLSQLRQLADAYRRPMTQFFDDTPIPVECVLWRERPPSPKAEELQRTLVDLAEKYQILETQCQQNCAVDLPFESSNLATYAMAEKLALKVRGELGLGDRPGQTLLRVLEEVRNVRVFHLDFEPSGSAACTLSDRFGAAILLNKKNVRWRRNFDLAHELFHLLTWRVFRHHEGGAPVEPSECEEKLATCFARNLLMPPEVFRAAIDSQRGDSDRISVDTIFDVAREFDVSAEAVVWQLGFVYNIPHDKRDVLVALAQCYRNALEVRQNDVPPDRPVRFQALARHALQQGHLSTGKFAEYLGISRREAMKFVEQEASEDVQIEISHP